MDIEPWQRLSTEALQEKKKELEKLIAEGDLTGRSLEQEQAELAIIGEVLELRATDGSG